MLFKSLVEIQIKTESVVFILLIYATTTVCLNIKYDALLRIYIFVQGYPQRMRLQKRLYGICLILFLIFIYDPCRKLVYFFLFIER